MDPQNWVEEYADYLYSFARYRVNREDLARDLVQDCFLSALRNLQNFKGDCSEKTWLTTILRNKIIDHYRKKSTSQELSGETGDPEDAGDDFNGQFFDENYKGWRPESRPSEWEDNPLTGVLRKEFYQVLKKCLDALPEKWAAAFTLKNMDDRSGEEVCKELGISSSNFWVIMHRAKLQLRSCMEKNWFGKKI